MPDLLVDALAVHRLTRLVTEDVITRPLRARIIRWAYDRRPYGILVSEVDRSHAYWDARPRGDDEAPKLAALLTCPWCVSVYVAAGALAVRQLAPGLWRAASYGLALSSSAALIANHEQPKR
jgi:hypothetical protein